MVAFDFYKGAYHGGSISETDWHSYAARAEAQLNRYKRMYTVTGSAEAESMAVCAMADAMAYFTAAQNGAGPVASASVGSVSVSYAGSTVDVSAKAQAQELYRCAALYLDIYRGVG